MAATFYLTQAGSEAIMAGGLAGLTNLKADAVAAPLPTPPDRGAVIGDFTLAAYTGYAQATPVLAGPYVRGVGGLVYYLTGEVKFNGPSSGPGIMCPGFVLQDSVSHVVWGWIGLDAPMPLLVDTDVAGFVLQLMESLQGVVVTVPF